MVKPSDLVIHKLPMWVRFYDLPFKGRSNDENARVLGNKVGEFVEVSKAGRGSMEKSLRIRILIDVRQPLKDHVSLKIRGGKVCIVPVKYERLPMICFYCGRLGHGSGECVEVLGGCTPKNTFGVSLRASPWKVFQEEDTGSEKVMGGRLRLPFQNNL